MDKRVLQERMKRKRRQMMMRKIYRLIACVLGTVLVLTLLFKGVISPLAAKISGSDGKAVEVKADSNQTDPGKAIRMPVKDQNNVSKAASLTAGWQEDANGKWYQNADGTFYANGMVEIDDNTYYVDENGYVQTGWVTVDGVDYMFGEDGALREGEKRKAIALTFDDGPGKYTMELLECLEEYGAHATFFMQGINAAEYPDEIRKMKEIGCELGNHSYDHPQLTSISLSQVSDQFDRADEKVADAAGEVATVARTPYGAQDEDILNAIGKPCFMWNIDTLDWKTLDPDATYNTVMDNITDGDIVLMHDIHETSVEASLRLIPDLVEQGYKLVTVTELAKEKGITLEPGKSYTDFCPETVAAMTGVEEDSDDAFSDSSDSSYDSEEDSKSDNSYDSDENSKSDDSYGSDEDRRSDNSYDSDEDNRSDNSYDSDEDRRSDSSYDSDEDSSSDSSYDSDEDSSSDSSYDSDEDSSSYSSYDSDEDSSSDSSYDSDEDSSSDSSYDSDSDSGYDSDR